MAVDLAEGEEDTVGSCRSDEEDEEEEGIAGCEKPEVATTASVFFPATPPLGLTFPGNQTPPLAFCSARCSRFLLRWASSGPVTPACEEEEDDDDEEDKNEPGALDSLLLAASFFSQRFNWAFRVFSSNTK
jgi:endogenous inhibitor of DNA gyrase (YacG/DUF329 family)